MRKTATNAQIAMFPKSTIQREIRQGGSDFRIWENTIGRTLHHFAKSCSKSGRGLSKVSIGLLFHVLYLLVLFWTCLNLLFCLPANSAVLHSKTFKEIQGWKNSLPASRRTRAAHMTCQNTPHGHRISISFLGFMSGKLSKTQMFQVQIAPTVRTTSRTREAKNLHFFFALCSRRRGK